MVKCNRSCAIGTGPEPNSSTPPSGDVCSSPVSEPAHLPDVSMAVRTSPTPSEDTLRPSLGWNWDLPNTSGFALQGSLPAPLTVLPHVSDDPLQAVEQCTSSIDTCETVGASPFPVLPTQTTGGSDESAQLGILNMLSKPEPLVCISAPADPSVSTVAEVDCPVQMPSSCGVQEQDMQNLTGQPLPPQGQHWQRSYAQSQQLLLWLESVGLSPLPDLTRPVFGELQNGNEPDATAGVLLCRLVEILEHVKIPGVDKSPRTGASKRNNIAKALAVIKSKVPVEYGFLTESGVKLVVIGLFFPGSEM
eukprot:gene1748-2904_t